MSTQGSITTQDAPGTSLSPSDAEAVADAITWLIVAEREHPDCPGIGASRHRLAALLGPVAA